MLYFRKMIKWGGYMPISFEKIGQYLHYLSEVHGVQFCIKGNTAQFGKLIQREIFRQVKV